MVGWLFIISYTLYLTMFNSLTLISTKWGILHIVLSTLSNFLVNIGLSFIDDLATKPGFAKLNYFSMGLGFSPIAQISLSLFLSQFRYVQYSLQHADDDVATILDSSFEVGIASSYAGRINCLLLCM